MWSRLFGKKEKAPPPDDGDGGDLVIVPIPQLIVMLEALEREKGRPLTEQEVLKMRDNAVCITMKRADADKLAESRGRDVDPENVWADWNDYLAYRASQADDA